MTVHIASNADPVITLTEAARLSGLSQRTLQDAIARGRLQATRVHPRLFFTTRRDLQQYLESRPERFKRGRSVTYYGTDNETFFVNQHGVVFLIQSPDFASDNQIERISELPANATVVDSTLLDDDYLNLPDWVYADPVRLSLHDLC